MFYAAIIVSSATELRLPEETNETNARLCPLQNPVVLDDPTDNRVFVKHTGSCCKEIQIGTAIHANEDSELCQNIQVGPT